MINIAIAGTGGIARTHAKCIAEIPDARIVNVFDTNAGRASEFAAANNARAGETYEDILEGADAVYVLTPPSTHRQYAVAAMDAGKHVLCEKPLASTVEDGETMVGAATRNGVILMTAFNQRFRKGFCRLKEEVASGSLGDMVSYWCQRLGMSIGTGYNWRTDPKLLCGMTIESLSHDIDTLRWIAGEIVDVRARLNESRPAVQGFDDNASIVMTMANGATATIHASWSAHLGRNSRGVIGTKGTAYIEGPGLWNLKTFRVKTDQMAETAETELNDTDFAYLEESVHFIDCIVRNKKPSITGEDGLAALKVSHAALRSHRDGVVVRIDTV